MNQTDTPLGVLMLDLEGPSLTVFEQEMLQQPAVGGLILFSRNFVSCAQLRDLISAIRESNERLLIAVDQEGGRVQRFRDGFLQLPALHSLSRLLDKHSDQAAQHAATVAQHCGWAMAAEILHYGIDISFAPVLDRYNAASSVIRERAFSDKVEVISELARSYIEGMHAAGMAATGKHYPGHGTVQADSHVELPIDERSLEEISNTDLQAFANCIDVLDGIMPAHVIYPAVDSVSAGYSRIWIEDILRKQLGFEGVIFSDDLSMTAAHDAGKVENRAELALAAGCDMILVCNDRPGALDTMNWLDANNHPASDKLIRMRAKPAAEIENLYASQRWAEASAVVKSLTDDLG